MRKKIKFRTFLEQKQDFGIWNVFLKCENTNQNFAFLIVYFKKRRKSPKFAGKKETRNRQRNKNENRT